MRCPGRRRQHHRHPGAHPAARPRRRRGAALGHQAAQRPRRRARRRARRRRPRHRALGRRAPPAGLPRRRAGSVRGLAAAAGDAHAVRAGAPLVGQRPRRRRGAGGTSAVAEVRYPGLPGHRGHELAARQMDGGFGMLVSVRVHGGDTAARRVLRRLELFTDATSLGSTESLVEHRIRVEGEGSPVPADLLRLSIGLEHPDDLVADLTAALDAEARTARR
ncbi:MAG: PLP-dependent transferase [Acidimicrobiales bacterium]